MNASRTLVFTILLGIASSVAAEDNIAVYATEKAKGTVSMGEKNTYTRTYDVSVANLTSNDIDLSKFCLKAIASGSHQEFKLDTLDETLVRGTLKMSNVASGIAVFASESDAIYQPVLVKISTHCQ